MDLDTIPHDPEGDFVNLLNADLGQFMFKMSAENILGKDWATKGAAIVKKQAPELLKKFEAYANESAVKKD